jgi:hypothetical protein
MTTKLYDKTNSKVKKFLRFYRTESVVNGVATVSRHQIWFTGDVQEAAEKISIKYENDKFFRWYEPLDQQIQGRHW